MKNKKDKPVYTEEELRHEVLTACEEARIKERKEHVEAYNRMIERQREEVKIQEDDRVEDRRAHRVFGWMAGLGLAALGVAFGMTLKLPVVKISFGLWTGIPAAIIVVGLMTALTILTFKKEKGVKRL